jgi:leader peptidase (prepilin peptidase)/N-methyltransferase
VSPLDLPRELWLVWVGTIGLFVGSFLNVAIHRLPLEGQTVSHPRRSRCPQCKRTLTWKENVPILSWLVQRGRCRGCQWPIPWCYPLVELLTAGLWLAAVLATPEGHWPLAAVRILVLSGLVVATFVDFSHFEIPDEISIGGIVLAPILSLLVPELHDGTWLARHFSARVEAGGLVEPAGVDRFGALLGCLGGMALGGGVLIAIGWLGKRVYGRDAMGFGDVKLLAGAGGFLGPGGVGVALMLASLVASVAGVGNILRFLWISRARSRRRAGSKALGRSLRSARIAGRYVPFGPYLALGIAVVLLYWERVRSVF